MTDSEFFRRFERAVGRGLRLWNIPSVAIGVVHKGQVVLEQGYGLRQVKDKLPADGQTLYQIGSCSKSFTATLAAKLVADGLLSWDEPVHTLLPELQFADAYTTEHVTLRDLLCHRTGLPRHEITWYGTDRTRQDIVNSIRYLVPNYPIRTMFQYNNQCYVAVGRLIERVTGLTWEQAMDKYLLTPLGMGRTCLYLEEMEADGNHALPYGRRSEESMFGPMRQKNYYRTRVENKAVGVGAPHGPAGSVDSCVSDMLRWVQLHLCGGELDGRQILPPEVMEELHQPQMLLRQPLNMPQEETTFYSYGLGWFVDCYRGHRFVWHGGNIDGFAAFAGFVPDLEVGIVVNTNMEGGFLHYALAREIIDHYLGIHDGNWVRRYYDGAVAREAAASAAEDEAETVGEPSRPLSAYTGTYRHSGYGEMTIYRSNGRLAVNFRGYKAKLVCRGGDAFRVDGALWDLPADLAVDFTADGKTGEITTLAIPLTPEPNAAPIRFRKV